MPDQSTPERPVPQDMLEREALYLLTRGDQPVWSVDDLGRALGGAVWGADAVGGLRRAGLIHQTSDGFVFASRAGVRAVGIIGEVV